MGIILRGQKGSALTYEELDGNLEQFYISSSLSSNGRILSLFTSGGVDTVTFPPDDTLQSITDNGNTTTNSITTLSFIKSGSTSDDILLGDGSTTSLSGIGGSTDTGSLLTTASVNLNEITFTKGDSSTFAITVDTGSANPTTDNISITVKNVWTGTIAKGTPCYITGSGTSGNVAGVVPADAGDASIMPAGVVLGEELTNVGDEGVGILSGFIAGVDTSLFNSGDSIYVDVGGGYTNTKPTGSALIQKLGNVEKVDAVAGSGVITGAGRSNDLPNIQQGYIWVGDSDGVPVAVSTGSLGIETQIFVTGSGIDSIQLNNTYTSIASGRNAFAGGGQFITASGERSTAVGGQTNKALGDFSTTLGGSGNTAVNGASSILGGEDNTTDGDYASIIGGSTHTGSGDYSFIGGGLENSTIGPKSAIIGGSGAEINATGSAILGGSNNTIVVNGNQSSIIAGSNNTVEHPASSIIGGEDITTSRKFTTFAKSVFVTGSTGESAADFGGILQLSRRTTTPSASEEGMIIHSGSSGASKLYFYNGTNWLVIAGGI